MKHRRSVLAVVIAAVAILLVFSVLRSRVGMWPTGRATGAEQPMGCQQDVLESLPDDVVVVDSPQGGETSPESESEEIPNTYLVRLDETLVDAPDLDDPSVDTPEIESGLPGVDEALARFAPDAVRRLALGFEPIGPERSGLAWTLEVQARDPAFAQELRAQPGVLWVEPVLRTRISSVPNDPYFPYQWHLSTIGLTQAWDRTKGAGAVVAVIDTGVSQQIDGLNELLPGYDFVHRDDDPSDEHWHGTHVAGTIAQVTDNGEGVSSVAPRAAILPVRVMNANGSGTSSDLAEGIVWAVDEGADVLNISLGFGGSSYAVQEACDYAEENGVLVVAATGNDGEDNGVQYPAKLDTVLAVGATDLNGDRTHYSNGGDELDMVAPGGDVDADLDGDGMPDGVMQAAPYEGEWIYMLASGTSMAAPHVSGVAALLVAQGIVEPRDLRDALTRSAEDLGDDG